MPDAEGRRSSTEELAAAIRDVAAHKPGPEALRAALNVAVLVTGCAGATVAVVSRERRTETVAASTAKGLAADVWQYEVGVGPGLDVVAGEAAFVAADLATDLRWPAWRDKVHGFGIGSVLAARLVDHRGTGGTLNLYWRASDAAGAVDPALVQLVAAQMSVVLSHSREVDNLWRTIDSRHLIGQAQGILMKQFGLTADRAFAVLRRYSQHSNVKLRDVAARVADTGELPPEQSGMPHVHNTAAN